MAHIKGMTVQSSGSRPHVVYIMHAVARTFPNVIWKIGGYKDRKTWGGDESAHASGRACDIYLDAGDPLDKKLGDLLFKLFYTQAGPLKVGHTIWNGHWWHSGHGPEVYTGSGGPHKDHVHVAFRDDHLDVAPHVFDWMCPMLVAEYVRGHDGASDRYEGRYGQAFDPRHPLVRLTAKQRKKILLKNMGMEGADTY